MVAINGLRLRLVCLLLGIILTALGSTFMIKVEQLGVQPLDSMYIGLQDKSGIKIGFWSNILGILLVALSLFMTKEKPKMGTFLDAVFLGVFLNLFIQLDFIPSPISPVSKISYFVAGTLLIALGSAIAIKSDLGAGPLETFTIAVSKKFRISFRRSSDFIEGSALLIAMLLEGPVHLGTVIFWVTIGRLIELFLGIFDGAIKLVMYHKYKKYTLPIKIKKGA